MQNKDRHLKPRYSSEILTNNAGLMTDACLLLKQMMKVAMLPTSAKLLLLSIEQLRLLTTHKGPDPGAACV
ncbi:unnamed protein product [Cercopithifilaria johnstoni]|uniref:Uncharacterized protein n=1 Tax=Cercopithifilaria johnstoni TaxID=2874296 RepID=A0A8J2Q4F6_9BILA|nr:unnamed protein product [Cercopithifilaria johnstoni]